MFSSTIKKEIIKQVAEQEEKFISDDEPEQEEQSGQHKITYSPYDVEESLVNSRLTFVQLWKQEQEEMETLFLCTAS